MATRENGGTCITGRLRMIAVVRLTEFRWHILPRKSVAVSGSHLLRCAARRPSDARELMYVSAALAPSTFRTDGDWIPYSATASTSSCVKSRAVRRAPHAAGATGAAAAR